MSTLKIASMPAMVFGLMIAGGQIPADQRTLFIRSAVEHADGAVTFPLYRGTSHGDTVYYIVLETSAGNLSDALRVNRAQKLRNARGTPAVQKISIKNGVIDFPWTVDFRPIHIVDPPVFQPGAMGEAGYSPLIEWPDGTIVNAPHVARDMDRDGRISLGDEAADKVVSIDIDKLTVTYRETDGFQGDRGVKYVSTDASGFVAAALEAVTFAPALDFAPAAGNDSTASSRASLAAFLNGQTGAGNPERQGINSALAGEGDPLNVLRWNPTQGRYSPLWDVHLAQWSDLAVKTGQNVRQRDWGDVQGLVDHGVITGPDGAPFGPARFIVNCPIVSRE